MAIIFQIHSNIQICSNLSYSTKIKQAYYLLLKFVKLIISFEPSYFNSEIILNIYDPLITWLHYIYKLKMKWTVIIGT